MGLEWRNVRVEDIAADQPSALATGPFGSAISSRFFVDEGVPVIRGSNLSTDIDVRLIDDDIVFISPEKAKEFSRSFAKRGDLVFTCWGTINQVGLIDENSRWHEYIVSNKQMKLTVDPAKAHSTYIYYVFSSPEKQQEILSNGIGAAVPGFNLGQLKKHVLRLPPLEIQDAIVRRIQCIDEKIYLNRRINQTLEAMAQAIFKSWFVDFDPVKARIAAIEQGEDPLRAAMRAISGKTDTELDQMPPEHHDQLAATAALFPDAMEESELGEIPKGWKVSTIGETVEIAGGATPDTKNESYWNPPEHFWTSPKDLSGVQSPVLLTTERKVSTAGLSRIGSGLLPKGTLLMSSRAPIGYLAITQIPVAINQGYIAMLPGGNLPPLYLLMWCQQNMEEIKGQANGSTFMEISKKAFRPMLVINPGSMILDKFIKSVTPLFGRIVEGVKESSQLANLRDTLLPKLLCGELSIGNIPSEDKH